MAGSILEAGSQFWGPEEGEGLVGAHTTGISKGEEFRVTDWGQNMTGLEC